MHNNDRIEQPIINGQRGLQTQQFLAPQQIVQIPQPGGAPQIILQPHATETGIRTRDNHTNRARGRRSTGWSQMLCGVLVFLFWIPSAALDCVFFHDGSGVWCGLMFVITGLFGVASAKQKTCRVKTHLVLSIVSAVFAGYCTITYTDAAIAERFRGIYYYRHYNQVKWDNYALRVSIDIILCLLSFIEMVLAIVGSACCCSACCKSPVYQVVVYGAPQPGVTANLPRAGNVQSYPMTYPQGSSQIQSPPHVPSAPPTTGGSFNEMVCLPPPYTENDGLPSWKDEKTPSQISF